MGKLAVEAVDYIRNSYEAQRNLGLDNGSKDAKMNMIVDSLTRAELEFNYINTDNLRSESILGKSLDSGMVNHVPDITGYDRTLRFNEYADVDILKHMQVTNTMRVGEKEQDFIIDDFAGEYKRLTSASANLGNITLDGQSYKIKSEMGGGSISWTQEDIDVATRSGRPLNMMLVRGIARKYLENIYDLVVYGNDKIKGLMNSNITELDVAETRDNPNGVAGAALKYLENQSARELVKIFTQPRIEIAKNTQSRWGGAMAGIDTGVDGNPSSLTCFIAQKAYWVLVDKLMTDASGGDRPYSVWSHLHSSEGMKQTGITKYVIVHAFDDSFANKTSAGFMVLPNSQEVYSFEKPLDLTPKPVQFMDLKMIIPYYDYFAGMKLIRNNACIAYKGIAEVA
jgi:hypothetical protein